MDIKGTTRVCGLIGNPVGHSVSPAIHNNLARLTGKIWFILHLKWKKEMWKLL